VDKHGAEGRHHMLVKGRLTRLRVSQTLTMRKTPVLVVEPGEVGQAPSGAG
jgi:hypothetical protein